MSIAIEAQGLEAHLAARRELPDPHVRRALRKAAGVSLEQIGRECGVTRQAVTLWESGAVEPRGRNLHAYLAVLRILREASP
jgi:DNA-binding transcriptional regulator YiaG